MKLLNLTLSTPAENLAIDESLLEASDQGDLTSDVLRLWESDRHFVVVGRASKVNEEVNLDFCRREKIEILRRCSGGATIVTGPGCLMYAVILNLRHHASLQLIEIAHQYVLGTMQAAMQAGGIDVRIQGTSDLTIDGKKFSGNSLHCKKNAILYHGTLLYDVDLELISQCSLMPPRTPEYRMGKGHLNFLTNLRMQKSDLQDRIIDAWRIDGNLDDWPKSETAQLVESRYLMQEWNFRH